MMSKRFLSVLGVLAAIGIGYAVAQVQPPPQVTVINGNDLFQDVVNGIPQAQNYYASFNTMAAASAALPARGNALVGGDATTNLFVYGTTGASETTTFSYGGPNNWAYGSAADAVTLNRDSTAARLPIAAYQYGFQLQRTAGQNTGGLVCMGQEVESPNVYQFQGTIAEFDFHVATGANFSGANNQMSAYIVYGTGTNEAIGKMFYTISTTLGTASGWAGGALAASPTITLSTAANGQRVTVVGSIPTTATELGVALCWTAPATAAGTTDSLTFAGIQLTRASQLASYASTSTAYINLGIATSFDRRPIALETLYQQRYAYQILESATQGVQQSSSGNGATTTTCQIYFPFPVTMFKAPTLVSAAASTSNWTITHVATATTLSGSTAPAVLGANTTSGGSVTVTVSSAALTTGQTCVLTAAGSGAGSLTWSANL